MTGAASDVGDDVGRGDEVGGDVGDDVGRGDEVGGDVGDNVGRGDVARGAAAGTSDATVGLPHAERAATLNMHSRSRCTGERYLP